MTDSVFRRFELEINDVGGKPVREGDVVLWTSEPDTCGNCDQAVCLVRWHGNKAAFCLRELDGWDPFTEYSYMRAGTYQVLGSSYDSPELVSKWEELGVRGPRVHTSNFLQPPIPCSCFPTAAINACVGAGIKGAFGNTKLVKQMSDVGECWKWGACIDEAGVLNVLRSEFEVDFVQTDLEDVVEEGGIVTIKIGNGAHAFHAAAVFSIGDVPYIVNSNLGEGRYVRPLLDIGEIVRSDDPEDHRDYMLLRQP
jgi:hypothetical protein